MAETVFTQSQYGPRCFGTSEKKTMADIEKPDYPAPGIHTNNIFNKTNPPFWKFGTQKNRDGFLQQFTTTYPAPNKYKINPRITKASPSTTFYNAKPSFVTDADSRYHYNPEYKIVKEKYPSFSFGYTQQIDYTTDVPAPNTYSPQQIQRKSFNKTQNSFTRMNRPNPYGQEATFAGVGEFEVSSKSSSPYTKFGTSKRPQNINASYTSEIHYEVVANTKSSIPGKSIGTIIKKIQPDGIDFPAPNHYNPTFINPQQAIFCFQGPRSTIHDTAVVKYPSPNQYVSQQQVSTKRAVSFTKSKRKQIFDQNPAPGTYQIKPKFSKRLGHMAKKIKALTQIPNPSSFDYKPEDHLTKITPQRPINQYSDRIDFSKSTTGKVGPGQYLKQEELRKAQLGKMSISLKLKTKDNKNPAPGQYEIPGSFGKLPNYYRLKRKLDSNGNVVNGQNNSTQQFDRRAKSANGKYRGAYTKSVQNQQQIKQMEIKS